MRLKKYLNENKKDIYLFDILRKECSQFLNELKESKNLLYRSKKENIPFYKKIIPRNNRLPLSMPKSIHNNLDKAFEKEFGWKVRSEGVFVSNEILSGYGIPYIFFPANGYKYVWSPEIDDLYLKINIDDFFLPEIYKINYYDDPEKTKKTIKTKIQNKIKNVGNINLSDRTIEVLKIQSPYFKSKNTNNMKYDDLLNIVDEWIDFDCQYLIDELMEKYKTNNIKNIFNNRYDSLEAVFKCKYYYLVNLNEFDHDYLVKELL